MRSANTLLQTACVTSKANTWLSTVIQLSMVVLMIVGCVSTALANITLMMILIGVLAQLLLIPSLRQHMITLNKNSVLLFVVGYFLVHLFGIGYTIAESKEIWVALRKASLFLFLPCLIFANRNSEKRAQLWQVFILTLTVLVLYETIRRLGWIELKPVKDRIFLGLFSAIAAFFVSHWTVLQKEKYKQRIGFCLALLFSCFVLFVNDGRSGHIVFFALVILFFLQHLKNKKQLIYSSSIVMLGLILLLVTPNPVKTRVSVLISETQAFLEKPNDESSMGLRYTFLTNFTKAGLKRPIMGWGTGALRAAYRQQTGIIGVDNPHSQYLYNFVQHGIVGLIVVAGLLASLFAYARRLPRLEQYVCQGLVIAYALGCLMNSWLRDFSGIAFFIVMVSLLLPAKFVKENKLT